MAAQTQPKLRNSNTRTAPVSAYKVKPAMIVQGAATTIYAATAPELAGKSGVYLDNCKIAIPYKPAQNANELAKKLWTVTEQQLRDAAAKLQS